MEGVAFAHRRQATGGSVGQMESERVEENEADELCENGDPEALLSCARPSRRGRYGRTVICSPVPSGAITDPTARHPLVLVGYEDRNATLLLERPGAETCAPPPSAN